MPLQQASTAITASNASNIETKDILSSLVMGVINTEITTQSARTDTDERIYKTELTLDADINDRTSPVQIIQSDATKVLLSDIEKALVDAGYRISCRSIKTRDGINDKVKLQVAWGP